MSDSSSSEESERSLPQMRNYPGKWDEYLAAAVVALPFVVLLIAAVTTAGLIITGTIRFDITFTADINLVTLLRPLALPVGIAIGGTYFLFALRFFGRSPVNFLLDLLDGFQRR